jgi:hypothetical protein
MTNEIFDDLDLYWWDQESNSWPRAEREDWQRWHRNEDSKSPLPPGERFCVCCVSQDDGLIVNIIPHRYMIDAAGEPLDHPDYPLSEQEREEQRSLMLAGTKYSTVPANTPRYHELCQRVYDWSLAPPSAGRALLAILFPRLDFSSPRISAFFGAYGLAPPQRWLAAMEAAP